MPILVRILLSLILLPFMTAHAQDEESNRILITNVRIFDGVNEELLQGQVLVDKNLISAVSAEPISAPGATVIDGGGRVCTSSEDSGLQAA